MMYCYPRSSGVTLLHFLDWKSKPKWLEEVTFHHANGFKSRTEPLLHLTRQQARQIARIPRGLQRERPIDTPPRGNLERVVPSVKQRKQDPTCHHSLGAVHHHGVGLVFISTLPVTSHPERSLEGGLLRTSGSSPRLSDARRADLAADFATAG